MPDRRAFLSAAAAGMTALATTGRLAPAAVADPTWMTYAPNAEMFWKKLPFLERLKKIAEAGFTRYEFGPWKTKDIDAIARANEELGLAAARFTGSGGIADPKRKDSFVEAMEEAVEVAQKLGANRLTVDVGRMAEGLDRDEQSEAVVDALKAVAEKAAEADVTLILSPLVAPGAGPGPLLATSDDFAAVVKAVGSKHVKWLFDIPRRRSGEGELSGEIAKHKDLIGYYRIGDRPGRQEPGTSEVPLPRVLKQIRDTGYAEPIGLELRPDGDPPAALKLIREADAAAKAL